MELPALDTKSYEEILAEAIARIPFLTDRWTDFNPQDTGILLLELMAGLTEQLNFMLDQVGEEFLRPYLRLAYGGRDVPDRFALDCIAPVRAVTPTDFETLACSSPFGIDWAAARFENHRAVLVVFRSESPLSQQEERAFYDYMKWRCLLGTQLEISQAARLSTSVKLRAVLDHKAARAESARQALNSLLRKAMRDKPMDAPLEADELMADILAVPGVERVNALVITCREEHGVPFQAYVYPEQQADSLDFLQTANDMQDASADFAAASWEAPPTARDAVMNPADVSIEFE